MKTSGFLFFVIAAHLVGCSSQPSATFTEYIDPTPNWTYFTNTHFKLYGDPDCPRGQQFVVIEAPTTYQNLVETYREFEREAQRRKDEGIVKDFLFDSDPIDPEGRGKRVSPNHRYMARCIMARECPETPARKKVREELERQEREEEARMKARDDELRARSLEKEGPRKFWSLDSTPSEEEHQPSSVRYETPDIPSSPKPMAEPLDEPNWFQRLWK